MKRGKLNIRIHNPNTEEETIRFVTRIFVDVGVQKLEQEVKKKFRRKTILRHIIIKSTDFKVK